MKASVPPPGFTTSRMNVVAGPGAPDSLPDTVRFHANSGGPTGQTPSELWHGTAGVSETLAGMFVDQTRLIDAEEVGDVIRAGQG